MIYSTKSFFHTWNQKGFCVRDRVWFILHPKLCVSDILHVRIEEVEFEVRPRCGLSLHGSSTPGSVIHTK
jgi:hypothetical protein